MGQRNSKRKQSYDVSSIATMPIPDPPVVPKSIIEEPELKAVEEENDQPDTSGLVPEWLNADKFHEVLLNNLENYEKIIKFNARPALGKGENYATLMLRVKIVVQLKDETTKPLSFMLKLPHDNEQMRQMLELANFFDSENGMYFEVLPELEQMYKDKGLEVKLCARAYKFERNSVLLEDLGMYGYKNANRLECLDMKHCELVLKRMAQFHAGTATRVKTRGPYPQMYTKGFGDATDPMTVAIFEGMMASSKKAFMDNVKLYKDYEQYEALLSERFEHITAEFLDKSGFDENAFNVLNHGDSWSNNILFKYAPDGSVEDLLFVDYQIPKYGTPVQDFLYFVFSSSQLDIKLKKLDYMLRYYHEQLVEHLKLLEYPAKIPKLRDLHYQLLDQGMWAMMSAILILPVVLLDPTDNASFENFLGDGESAMALKNMFYSNPRFVSHINEILPWMRDRGFLDLYDLKNPKPAVAQPALQQAGEVQPLAEPAEKVPVAATFETTERSPIPDWLTAEYFIDILQKQVPGFKQVKHFCVKPGTSAGDNYASTILAVNIDVELEDHSTKQLSFMLKVSLQTEQAAAMLSTLDVFDKERLLYSEYIPAFEGLYKDIGLDISFAPKFYDFTRDPGCKTVLLENLRPRGFKNADRLTGLDLDHVKAGLAKMAQFHAASARWVELHGDFPAILQKGMFHEENVEFMEKMMETFFGNFIDAVKTFEGHEEYLHKLEGFKTTSVDVMREINRIDPSHFNVLNHGDCWTNNFMFQYDASGKKIAETLLVDYQMSKYGSPAQDLYYFLCSSPQLRIKIENFDECIKFYHEQLVKHLRLLSYAGKVPSLKEFHMHLLGERGGWAFSTICGVMSAVLLDPTEDASMELWLSNDDAGNKLKQTLYTQKRYREHATAQLTWCNQRGLLDHGADFQNASVSTKPIIADWINAANFSTLLRDELPAFEKITKFDVSPATKSGDNYASLMLRANIEATLKDGSTEHVAYILKVPPQGAESDKLVDEWNFFPKERAMYSKFIPAFERLYADAGKPVHFAPKFVAFKQEVAKNYIIMEDLQKRGFKTGNRLVGFDLEHTKWVLKKMAQFHAASARYVELNGNYPEDFNVGIYNKDTAESLKEMFVKSSDEAEEAIREYSECQDFVEKLIHNRYNMIDRLVQLADIDPNEFNVLNHGDSWLNNIMFQHNEQQQITDMLFVDFQVCKYGTPANDLWYFIMSSTQLDIKIEQFDYFIKYYYDNLLESLKLLQYAGQNVPTLRELHETLIKYGFLGVAHTMGVTAIALIEPIENMSMDTFINEDEEGKEMRRRMYAGERIKANCNVVLPWLNKRGLLDE